MNRRLVSLGLIAVLATSGGCSFLFIDNPPSRYKEGYSPSCDTGRGWTYVDMVFALSYLSAGSGIIADGESAPGGSVLLAGGVFAASAILGRRRTGRCRELRVEHEDWLADVRNGRPATEGNSWDEAPSGWDKPIAAPPKPPPPEPAPPAPSEWDEAPPEAAPPPVETAPEAPPPAPEADAEVPPPTP